MNAVALQLRHLGFGVMLGLVISVLGAGCSGGAVGAGSTESVGPTSATATLPEVVIVPPTATPTIAVAMPAQPIIAPSPQLPTPRATVTRLVTAEPTMELPAATPTITPTATDLPPTFTPPPPPPASPSEHLIFGRPVPDGATQWTDKAYPYGSTRGGTLAPHHGVEFAVPSGTPVLATAGGTVRVSGPDDVTAYGPQTDFYGNVVIIEHGPSNNGLPLFTVYGHLSEVQVVVGQTVVAGEPIGLSGDSGVAYGPHLHYEVREGANTYMSTRNPLLWLRTLSGTGVVAGLVTYAEGQPAFEVPVTLRRVDGLAPYTASTSYAQAPLNGDLVLGENFALDDVVPGYYEISVGTGREISTQELWVFPGRTTFVTIALP